MIANTKIVWLQSKMASSMLIILLKDGKKRNSNTNMDHYIEKGTYITIFTPLNI